MPVLLICSKNCILVTKILLCKQMKNYIERLHVKNIGLFDELTVEFSPNVNIIIGANSTGKTSILKCITFCFNTNSLNTSRARIGADFWIDTLNEGIKARVGSSNIVDSDQAYRQFIPTRWESPPVEVENLDNLKTFYPWEDNSFNLYAIGAYRYFEYQQINGMIREGKGKERKDSYNQSNTQSLDQAFLPNVKQWMINRYFVIEKDWAYVEKHNWEKVMNFLPKMSPQNVNGFKFSRIERDLEPIFSVNNKECYLEELSGGFKSILSIIFSIVDWCEGVNEGELGYIENACGTVLIDEIDAHLHPEWQSTVVKSLKTLFPNIQFILTTHSPYVIANAEQNEIINIPNHNGTIDLSPLNKSYQGWTLSNITSDLMGVIHNEPNNIEELIIELDKALDKKDKNGFDDNILKLKELLHPNDSIIQVYEIKRSAIFL